MTSPVPEGPHLGSFEIVKFREGHPSLPVSGIIQCPHGERYLFKVSADGNTCDLPLDDRVNCGCDVDEVRYEGACFGLDLKEKMKKYVGWAN